ncbi:MAG: ABC transporter ATP-binding protein [Chloroflexi bacterium]|nr:ABC transporter ATP-binding protein [Chloroflexota bacterium]
MASRVGRLIKFIKDRTEKNEHLHLTLTALFAVILNLLAVIIPVLQKKIIDSMSIKVFDQYTVIFFLVAGIAISITTILEALVLNSLFIKFKNSIQMELLESVTRKDNKIIKARGPGAFMVSIFGDSEQIAMLLNTNYFSVLAVCLAGIVTLVISTMWTWFFSYIVIISYIIIFIIIRISNKIYLKSYDEARNVVYELNPQVLEFIENRKSIVGYVNVKMYEAKLKTLFDKRDEKFKSAFAANAIGRTSITAVKDFALTVFFVLSMIQIIDHQLELSSFIALLSYFNVVFVPVSALHELYGGLNRFDLLFNRIKDNIDIVPVSSLPEDNRIRVQNCSFSYEDGNSIVSNIDLELDEKIGLVGLTGEGKTTMLKMLTGELLPSDGIVLFGGTSVNTMPKSIINSSIRLYTQDPEIFDESLEFNITLGKRAVSRSEYFHQLDELMIDINNSLSWLLDGKKQKGNIKDTQKYMGMILNLYCLNEKQYSNSQINNQLIRDLEGKNIENISRNLAPKYLSRICYIKEKYDQIVTELKIEYLSDRRFGQRGKDISGGEKNKVALARFLLPESDEPFVIDEPFSNLDLFSEQENLDILKAHITHKKGIIISHKINVIQTLSDSIVVLENGRVSERGTHNELILRGGLYCKLYNKYLGNIHFGSVPENSEGTSSKQ